MSDTVAPVCPTCGEYSNTTKDAQLASLRAEVEQLRAYVRELEDERTAEVERLTADAERYRWLRKHAKDNNVWQPIDAPERFDAAIDAACQALKGE
jgi:hypothetical protein